MGRFSDAKIWGAIDAKFQQAYNYLIDLLDTGYSTESNIGGHKVKIDINPTVGFTIKSDNEIIGGITDIGGVLSSISQIITNDPTDPECWATIGEEAPYHGIFIFRKSISKSIPALKILLGASGDFYLQDINGVNIFDYRGPGQPTIVNDSSGKIRFYADETTTRINDPSEQVRFYAEPTTTRIYDNSGNVRFLAAPGYCYIKTESGVESGVDSGGGYSIVGGVKKYYVVV